MSTEIATAQRAALTVHGAGFNAVIRGQFGLAADVGFGVTEFARDTVTVSMAPTGVRALVRANGSGSQADRQPKPVSTHEAPMGGQYVQVAMEHDTHLVTQLAAKAKRVSMASSLISSAEYAPIELRPYKQ